MSGMLSRHLGTGASVGGMLSRHLGPGASVSGMLSRHLGTGASVGGMLSQHLGTGASVGGMLSQHLGAGASVHKSAPRTTPTAGRRGMLRWLERSAKVRPTRILAKPPEKDKTHLTLGESGQALPSLHGMRRVETTFADRHSRDGRS